MKKILYATVLTLMVSSCDFLSENPTTSLSEAMVYDTESALESNIRGIVEVCHSSAMYTHDMQEFMQTASCLCYYPQGSEVGKQNTNERYYSSYHYAQFSNMQQNVNMFKNHYLGIQRCNKLIDGLADSPVDPAYKLEIEAEAKFYRAVYYFSLVRFYGNVPLHVTVIKDSDQADAPRAPYYDVYDQILKDLDFAWNNMRSKERVKAVTGGESRPYKYAAKAFEAAVYVQIGSYLDAPDDHAFGTQKTGHLKPDFTVCGVETAKDAWEKALAAAELVINEGQYSLQPRYQDLFRYSESADFQSDERIFIVPVTNSSNGGLLGRRSLPEYPMGTANTVNNNTHYGRFRPTRFVFEKWAETYGGTTKIEEVKTPTGNIEIEHYVSCPDPRFDATFYHTQLQRLNDGAVYNIYPSASAYGQDARKYILPYFKKYLSPTYDGGLDGDYDFYFMRYAEVILFAAEAAASLASSPTDANAVKAKGYIEQLHYRARNSVAPATSQPTWKDKEFKTTQDLVNAIFWERVYELYGEGHEWFDTHRRGTKWFLNNVIIPFNDHLESPENGYLIRWYSGDGKSPYSEKEEDVRRGLFCAYSSDDLMYNRALDSNDQNIYIWR